MSAREIVGEVITWFSNYWVMKYVCNKKLH